MTITSLTRDLVAIPSHTDETAAGDAIEHWLSQHTDAQIVRDPVGNVIARKGSGDTSIALVGHHDVVPPDPEQTDGDEYRVSEADGRLYGRGTADMKGALAAMLHVFRDADPGVELMFASFIGEETGGDGARYAIEHDFSPDYAIVGEGSTNYAGPDQTDVAIAHKGRRGSTITAAGKSAHASEPDAGENAVYRACDAIDVIRSLARPATDVHGHHIEGSVVVTEVSGGTAWNVIPDTCRLTVDERTVPGDRASLGRVEELEGIEWVVDQDLPPMACDDLEFARDIRDIARETAGAAELVTKPHATDAGWLANAGTTCVIFGPAEPGEAHTASESVSIDTLQRCYHVYRDVVDTF